MIIFQIWAGPFPIANKKMIISCPKFATLCKSSPHNQYIFYCDDFEKYNFMQYFNMNGAEHTRVIGFNELLSQIKSCSLLSRIQNLDRLIFELDQHNKTENTKKLYNFKKEIFELIALIYHGGFFFDTSTSFLEEVISSIPLAFSAQHLDKFYRFETLAAKPSIFQNVPIYPVYSQRGLLLDVWFAYAPHAQKSQEILMRALNEMIQNVPNLTSLCTPQISATLSPQILKDLIGREIIQPIWSALKTERLVGSLFEVNSENKTESLLEKELSDAYETFNEKLMYDEFCRRLMGYSGEYKSLRNVFAHARAPIYRNQNLFPPFEDEPPNSGSYLDYYECHLIEYLGVVKILRGTWH